MASGLSVESASQSQWNSDRYIYIGRQGPNHTMISAKTGLSQMWASEVVRLSNSEVLWREGPFAVSGSPSAGAQSKRAINSWKGRKDWEGRQPCKPQCCTPSRGSTNMIARTHSRFVGLNSEVARANQTKESGLCKLSAPNSTEIQ